MAPPGKHVMSCFVQYAPYELREGTWDQKREAFGDTVIDALARYIPNLKDIILHRQVVTPLDIERTTGLSQGNIFQGELTPSQLFFLRPRRGIREIPDAGEGVLPMWVGDAPGWRDHGGAGEAGGGCGDGGPGAGAEEGAERAGAGCGEGWW